MERLLYSSSSSLSSLSRSYLEPRTYHHEWRRFHSWSPPFFSFNGPEARNFSSFYSKISRRPCFCSSITSSIHDEYSANRSNFSVSSDENHKCPDFPTKKAISTGAVIFLSSLVLFLVRPFVPGPAYASTTLSTAQTGSSTGTTVGGSLVRIELFNSAWTGFLAGCLHTLSGPDHLAALAPLSIGRSRMESAVVGALWGCGHDAGQLIFGLLFLLLKDRLHVEVIRTWGTRVVGLTLLVIGGMGIREASEVPTPCVALENGECDTSIIETLEIPSAGKKKVGFATFATGIVHGLQPDALMMVLPALALPSRLAGVAFLSTFLLGTVFSMGSYTVFIGSLSQALKDRIPRITEKLTVAASLVAIALGIAILVSQIFGFSLY